MKVTTWSLQATEPSGREPRPFPEDVRWERVPGMTPEYARFLYGFIGGDWYWVDRLGWTRQQWVDDVTAPATEFWLLTGEGAPLGYAQIHAELEEDGAHVEILHLGLAGSATGRGLGGRLLEHTIAAAWSLPERFELPPVARVWVHTCSLDHPSALANYRARGLELFRTDEDEKDVAARPPGPWAATGGPVPGSDA